MGEINRRVLKTRNKKWVSKLAAYISQMHITPNQISIVSVLFAALAGGAFWVFGMEQNPWLLLIAAVMIQMRLLCNLMDGLVAIEGGKSTPSGELFNDVPDRIADVVILVSLGHAVVEFDHAVVLGWVAGVLAVMTAYVRTLGASLKAPTRFTGPMAKQHRMALVTAVSLLAILELAVLNSVYIMYVGLWMLIVGTLITVYRRLRHVRQFLEQNHV